MTGSSNNQLSPYAIVGVSGTYAITKNLSLTTGVDNLFDKRLFREGNAQGVTNIDGAGAAARVRAPTRLPAIRWLPIPCAPTGLRRYATRSPEAGSRRPPDRRWSPSGA